MDWKVKVTLCAYPLAGRLRVKYGRALLLTPSVSQLSFCGNRQSQRLKPQDFSKHEGKSTLPSRKIVERGVKRLETCNQRWTWTCFIDFFNPLNISLTIPFNFGSNFKLRYTPWKKLFDENLFQAQFVPVFVVPKSNANRRKFVRSEKYGRDQAAWHFLPSKSITRGLLSVVYRNYRPPICFHIFFFFSLTLNTTNYFSPSII